MRRIIFPIFIKIASFLSEGSMGKLPLLKTLKGLLLRCLKPPPDIVIVSAHGNKMYVDSIAAAFLADEGYLQKGETRVFKRIVREGMTIVDIGAHIGYYTLMAAKLVGEKGKVFAFEPDPDNYRLLVKNIEANGYNNVIPVPKAVSNQAGTTKLFLSPEDSGAHRIYNSHDGRKSIQVETVTLDGFFKDKENRIDIIKMDIEGAEIAALQGMKKILKNDDLKLLTEFWPQAIRTFGYSPEDGLSELVGYGFRLFCINELKGEIIPSDINSLMQMCTGKRGVTLYIGQALN
jgi:FkbM family methyltransferase